MNNQLRSVGRLFRPVRKLLVEFCDNSNIHGVRYLTERCLHWSERLWWLIALSVSLWLCGSAAHNIWIEWRDNPMTLSFTETPVSTVEIPFPTLTICPEIKSKKSVFDLESALEKPFSSLTQFERKSLNAMAHIYPGLSENLRNTDNFTDESIYETIKYIALKHKDVFKFWVDFMYHDLAGIVPVLTEEGFCFTFNSLNSRDIYTDEMALGMMIVKDNKNASDWSLEKDFQNKSTEKRYPIHGMKHYDFSAVLQIYNENIEYKSRKIGKELKVILTTPGDVLKFSAKYYRVPLEEETLIFIKPKLTTTSEGLRKYAPHQRQCFFDSERRLRFFKIYSQSNCEEECQANITNTECGCVKFSMPRHKEVKICGVAKIDCYQSIEKRLSSNENTELREKCNCLPSCISIEYEAEVDRLTIGTENVKKTILAYRPDTQFLPTQMTRLTVDFKGSQVQFIKRIESLTYSDFLAFFGGLLGVYLGISALSFVEIVYYSTLRLYWIIRPLESARTVNHFQRNSSNILNRCQFVRGVRAFVVEYCDNSSIHGVIYFTRRGLHWIERLWWIIAFGLALWLCTAMSANVWQGWSTNPVKMTFTRNERSISEVPFPTITICPEIKTVKHKFDLNPLFFLPKQSIGMRSFRNNKLFQSLFHVCSNIPYNAGRTMLTYPQNASEDIFDIFQDVAPQLHDVINDCIWQGKVVNCSTYIAPILTREGLCFAFNALNSYDIFTDQMAPGMLITKNNPNVTKWALENGYENGRFENVYPRRVYGSGQGYVFEMSLHAREKDFELYCHNNYHGFRVVLNAPGEETKFAEYSFGLQLLEQTVITVRSTLTTTSHGLRKYDPSHRKCFFQSERQLRFYKIYTQNNCYEECLANFTASQCGCVKFSQPRDRNTSVCGVAKILCYSMSQMKLTMYLIAGNELARAHYEACNCLPSCTSIEYKPVVDRVKFDKGAIALTKGHAANMSGIQQSKLVIFFEDQFLETEQREELYTITDLLSICGGLVGLFMGVSVLSIIEILYYSSLRWYWILRRPESEQN